MAMTLAEVRAKYPAYANVDDQTLADGLYEKFYLGTLERREFDARIGLKPYQNIIEAAPAVVANSLAGVQLGKQGVAQMAAEAVTDYIAPQMRGPGAVEENPPPVGSKAWLEGRSGIAIDLPGPLDALPEVRDAIANTAAKTSLAAQLRALEAKKGQTPTDMKPGSFEHYLAGGVAATAEMVPSLAASVALRNPWPAMVYAGTMAAGQSYISGKDSGLTPDQARDYAALYAAAEGIPEALPVGLIIKEGGTLLMRVGGGAVTEAVQEGFTEGLQALIDKGFIAPDMTWDEVWPRIKDASLTGLFAGGLMGGVAHGIDKVLGPSGVPQSQPGDPLIDQTDAAEIDQPIEESVGLPPQAPQLLALPPPDASPGRPLADVRPPDLPGPAPQRPEAVVAPTEDELVHQAQIALRRTRQEETAALLETARQTITPLGTFQPAELDQAVKVKYGRDGDLHDGRMLPDGTIVSPGVDADRARAERGMAPSFRVAAWRQRTGKPLDRPITVEDMARARVPQSQIDAAIESRKPFVEGQILKPEDVIGAARARNIIADDTNFGDLAFKTTGSRRVERMSQTQLRALKSVIEAMPAHEKPVTIPVADAQPFDEKDYNKAVDAVRRAGRFTLKAVKDAIADGDQRTAQAIRDAMVRRGQLVKRAENDYRLYDVIGQERQQTPQDLPPGAFKEHVIRRLPVNGIRVKKDGKSVGVFGSATAAREKVRELREAEGGAQVQIALEPAEETAWGVLENRYDATGTYIGQAVVDTARDEAAAQTLADKLNSPTLATTTENGAASPPIAPIRKPLTPAALAGRIPEIVGRLNKIARQRKLPLLGAKVTLTDGMRDPAGRPVEGQYLNNVITIALAHFDPSMNDTELTNAIAEIMDHELIHALRKSGVLAPETDGWRTIVRYAKRTRRPGTTETYFEWAKHHYTGVPGYENGDTIEEEAIAEAFRHWAANRRDVVGQPASVFRQIVEWFRNLLKSIPNDLFASIESGAMVEAALRPPGSAMPRARAARRMATAKKGVAEAAAAGANPSEAAIAENLKVINSREFIRARAQAREDRFGRSGPKTVLGTTPSKAYDTGELMDRTQVGAAVERYKAKAGLTSVTGLKTYLPEDVEYLERVADAQQRAAHEPDDAAVRKAYRALANETRAMFDALGNPDVIPWTADGAPYASPAEMMADIAAGQVKLRLSQEMYGEGADNANHPMYAPADVKASDGTMLVVNDLFRIVHDVYGRGQIGLRSTPRDDYNAYHEHARLLSPEARRALATETLAQSAWANYGPHLRRRDGTVPRATDIDYLPPNQKEFAEQKAFLLSEDLVGADPGWALADQAAEAVEQPKFSVFDENLPGGRLYGNANRSPGGALSRPGTPSPAFTNERDGNRFFGGEMAEHQLQMTRTGERGATILYLTPNEFLGLSSEAVNPEQEVYDAAIAEGYKFSTLPSLVVDGYAGNVRVTGSDGAYAARAVAEKTGVIPVAIYPRRSTNDAPNLGHVTALEANGFRVLWPHDGRQENIPSIRGPRYSVGSEAFKKWFGDSKVVNPDGSPRVVYHGTTVEFEAFDAQKARSSTDGGMSLAAEGVRPFFFTSSREVADEFAMGGRTIEAYLRFERPLIIEAEGKGWYDFHDQIVQAAKGDEYDGVILKSVDDVMFGDEIEDSISDVFVAFEPTQIKSATANKGTYDAANPDIRYSLTAPFGSRVPPASPPSAFNIVHQRTEGWLGQALRDIGRSKRHIPIVGSIFDARVKLQDKMLPVKEMIEDLKERGGEVNDLNDTYMEEQLYHGRVVEEIREREQALMLPLLNALKAEHGTVTPKEFEDYLYARHAPERNAYLRARGSPVDNPSGMSDREASDILDRFALAGKQPALERLAALADRVIADTTKTRNDAGLISDKAAKASPYKFYVPLRGFAEEDLDPDMASEGQTRARSGKGFSVGGREDRSTTGRNRKAGDLLGHIFLQNTEAVIRAEKNKVAMSFIRLVEANKGLGYGEILKGAPTRLVTGPNGMIHEAGDPQYRQDPSIVIGKYKGGEIIARVADPRIARAVKSDYVTSSNGLVRAMGMLNRYLATVNTSWNPEFLISNLARDAQTAGILSQQYDIKGLGRKIIGNAPKAMGGIREVLRKGTATTPWAEAFRELQKQGGTTEFLGINDLETQVARIRSAIGQTGLRATARKTQEQLGRIGKFIDDYNKVAENAFRLSAFVAAREAGVPVRQAAFLAKNLTVNFNKGGEMKTTMNAAYLFYNASMQGSMVLLNGLRSKRVRRIAGGIVIAGILQDLLNRAVSGDDDNGIKDYDDVPDYVLRTNFVIMDPLGVLEAFGIKSGYIAIPMPYGFNAFYNLGRNFGAVLGGGKTVGDAVGDAAVTALDSFNPLGGANDFLNFVAPTLADPLVEIATNKDFADNAIVPERPTFGVPVPESQKYWSNTSELPRDIAEYLNKVTGGNEVRKGAIDVSPELLQYWFDFATGAAGKFAMRTSDFAIHKGPQMLQGDFEDVEIGDIPFARRVIGSVTSRNNTERFYTIADEIATVAAEIKFFQEDGNVDALRATLRDHPIEVRLINAFSEGNDTLSDLRKQLRDLRENEAVPAARRVELERLIKERQDQLMARLIQLYTDVRKQSLN